MTFRFFNSTFSHDVTSNAASRKLRNHTHSEFEILLFVSGSAEYAIDNQKYTLAPYSLILTRPCENHFLSFNSSKENYERYWIHFNLETFPLEIQRKLLGDNKVIQLDSSNRICKIFKIMEEYSKIFPPEKYPKFFDGLLTEMVFLISLETDDNDVITISEAEETTAKILKYVNEHITEPLSVKQISDALFISPSTLCHKFSQTMKIGVMKYVKKKKIYYADKLIKQGVKPTKAATVCGYGDYSSFYRAYKEIFGVSPKRN